MPKISLLILLLLSGCVPYLKQQACAKQADIVGAIEYCANTEGLMCTLTPKDLQVHKQAKIYMLKHECD